MYIMYRSYSSTQPAFAGTLGFVCDEALVGVFGNQLLLSSSWLEPEHSASRAIGIARHLRRTNQSGIMRVVIFPPSFRHCLPSSTHQQISTHLV